MKDTGLPMDLNHQTAAPPRDVGGMGMRFRPTNGTSWTGPVSDKEDGTAMN